VVEIAYNLPIREDGKFDLPGFVQSYYLEYDRVADRRFPFEFYYPLRVSARTSVRVPPGRALAAGPGRPEAAESRFGRWHRNVSVEDNRWEIRFDYEAARALPGRGQPRVRRVPARRNSRYRVARRPALKAGRRWSDCQPRLEPALN
jgi:hypothetical protein